jgi:hypothetical protein
MVGFGPRIDAGFTENFEITVVFVSMGQDPSERAVSQLPSAIYKSRMIVKLIKRTCYLSLH